MVNIDASFDSASTDSDSTKLRSRWSSDLLAETFSAGSVDVCQVIRSDKPPPVPLRMEMRCDGFETVRTKRKTINKCIEKIDKTKDMLISQMKESSLTYDAYKDTCDAIKEERRNQLAFNQKNSIGFSSKSSSDLIQESFSVGSVDICQVIRSDKPPPVPLRMEMRCDGFETVLTKRNTINRCIKKLEKARKKLLETEKQNAVSYSDYVATYDQVREKRQAILSQLQNEYLNPKKSGSTFGTISEDNEVVPDEREVINEYHTGHKYYEENTETTIPSSNEWTGDSSQLKSIEENHDPSSYESPFSSQSTGSNITYEEFDPGSSLRSARLDHHNLLFMDVHSVQDDNTIKHDDYNAIENKRYNELTDITRKENLITAPVRTNKDKHTTTPENRVSNSKYDKYSEAHSHDDRFPSLKEMNQTSRDSFMINSLGQRKNIHDDFSYSIASLIKSMTVSDEMLSYAPVSQEVDERKDKNSQSDTGSTIMTTSAHRALTDHVIITFSSESNKEKQSEHSFQPINSLFTPDYSDYISLASDIDDDTTDRYKSIEARIGDQENRYEDRYESAELRQSATDDVLLQQRREQEINFINMTAQSYEEETRDYYYDDEVSDEVSDEFCIPIAEYDFGSEQYVHYIDAEAKKFHYVESEQYHYIDSKYRFSNLEQNENEVLNKGPNDYFVANACVNLVSGFDPEEIIMEMEGNRKISIDNQARKEKKKRKRNKKKEEAFAIEEIFIEAE